VVERIILLSQDELFDIDLIPEQGLNWDEHEKEVIQQALARCSGNKSKAAKLLNLSYKTFIYRLEKILK